MADLRPLIDIITILTAMVGVAAVFIRLRLGPTLGYLAAGLLIGPSAFDFVRQSLTTDILGELGVVFLLFMIGLELPLKRIQTIGAKIILLGVLQVCLTSALIAYIAIAWGGTLASGLAIGAGLALSSTTIVLRQLTDRGLLTSKPGRSVFAILMVQDLLVGPILVTIMALSSNSDNLTLELGWAFAKSVLAVAAVILGGRYVLNAIYRPIAASNNPELFTGLSFLVVIGLGFLTHEAGLSLAFGGFLAGVLLADTHYRHQVAADIRPLRGLLLGVFFVTVGMRLEPAVIWQAPLAVMALTFALMVSKAVIIVILCMAFRMEWSSTWRCGLMLAQGGEFAFVLWTTATDAGILPEDIAKLLVVVVAISMAITPLLFELIKALEPKDSTAMPFIDNSPEASEDLVDHVVVIGCGTVGRQVVNGLMKEGITAVALDNDAEKVRRLREVTELAFFGDATQPEMLEMVHVENAFAVVVAIDDYDQTTMIVGLLRYLFDDLPILARAEDEKHGQRLELAGATTAVPEVIDTGRHLVAAMMIGEREEKKS